MAYNTRKQARDLLKAKIEVIAGLYTVYTNIFEKGKVLPSINIVYGGNTNYIDSYDARADNYKFSIYVLNKIESITTDTMGTVFDDALDDTMDNVEVKNNEVLQAIQGVIMSLGDSSIIKDFTDGNNRLCGLVTEVQITANR